MHLNRAIGRRNPTEVAQCDLSSPVARRPGGAHSVAFLSCLSWSLGGMVPPSQTVRSPILSWLVTYTIINVKITSTSDRRGCHPRIIVIGVIIIAIKIIILHSPANFQGCRVPCLARVRRQPPIINGVAESRTLDFFPRIREPRVQVKETLISSKILVEEV
jgi:hypothetical protein